MKFLSIIIILIFPYFKTLAQCEDPQAFEIYNQGANKLDDAYDWNDPNVAYWGTFVQTFGLHFAYFNMTTLPANLLNNQTDITNQTQDCINQWSSGGCLKLLYDNNFPYVELEFSDDGNLFPTGTEYGATLVSFSGNSNDGWQFEYNNGGHGTDQTRILLNRSTTFLQNYTWSIETYNPGEDYVTFKPVLLHELGHVIGLGHIANSNGAYVMSFGRENNHFLFQLTDCDKNGRTSLCKFNGQNPSTPMVINPFRNREHSFFQYEPARFLFYNKINDTKNIENMVQQNYEINQTPWPCSKKDKIQRSKKKSN